MEIMKKTALITAAISLQTLPFQQRYLSTYSYNIPAFLRWHQHTTYMPGADYTDYTVRYIVSEDYVYVIFLAVLSINIQI